MIYHATLDEDGKEGPPVRFSKLASHWVFTGSEEKMTENVEPLGGSIVGIREEPECCINTLYKDAIGEAEWFADEKAVPPVETKVTLIIRPAKS
jgi:hypothetical protein